MDWGIALQWFNLVRTSLRNRVLAWLIIPLLNISVIMLAEVYYSAARSTGEIQDQMLVSQAIGISEQAASTGGDLYHLEVIQRTSGKTVFYKSIGPQNSYMAGFGFLPLPNEDTDLMTNVPHFYDATYRNQSVRMVALKSLIQAREINGYAYTYVGQFTAARENLIWQQVMNSSVRLGIFIIIAVIFAWLAVAQGLRPLARLQESITRRSFDDMRPIQVDVPKEVDEVTSELNNLLVRLENSIQSNKRFISNASHQLRTPVASLMAQTELLLRDATPQVQAGQLANINARANQLSRLINQLLTLMRADVSDKLVLEMRDLVIDIGQICMDWYNNHPQANIEVHFEPHHKALSCMVNHTLLVESLNNLLDNANLYCPPSSHLTVSLAHNQNTAIIMLDDDGPGIPTKDRERVLERFCRLHEDHDGSGLGLAIAKEVALRHGGDLELVDSEHGNGLGIRLRLPMVSKQT